MNVPPQPYTSTLTVDNATTPVKGGLASLPVRSLEDVALENAVEGCVRESYGAWNAARQASLARDPEVRGAMRRIASDEARHAALAWDIHAWAIKRLSPSSRRRVLGAMQQAALALHATAPTSSDAAAVELGMAPPE